MATEIRKTLPRVAPDSRGDIASVVESIRSIVHVLRVSARETEQKLGISSAQLYVLQALRDQPALSINQLAERTYTHQSSVSMVVAKLVESHLVTRTAARRDARKVSISLTAAGRAMLRKSPGTVQARLVDALRTMPRSEVRSLASTLDSFTSLLSPEIDEVVVRERRSLAAQA